MPLANKQKILREFGVKELRAVLSFAGKKTHGRVNVLRARVVRLVDESPSNALTKKIYELRCDMLARRSMRLRKLQDDTTVDLEGIEEVHSTTSTSTSRCRSSRWKASPLEKPLPTPIHPDVSFKALPFFKVLKELLKPTSLSMSPTRIKLSKVGQVYEARPFTLESISQFHLTPQQALGIRISWDERLSEYSTQILLRICLLETTSEQEDHFPPGLSVWVNKELCPLKGPSSSAQKINDVKRLSCPIDITALTKLSATAGNVVRVVCNPHYQRFVYGVYLVERESSDILMSKLRSKGLRVAPYTKGMIQRKLQEDPECEIAMTCLRVSLVCPLGKMRMTTPCRAITCDHVQCFDAALYLQMNERKPSWVCPVCDRSAHYDVLVLDEYFMEVISSEKLPENCKEVQLHPDGSWTPLAQERDDVTTVPHSTNQGEISGNAAVELHSSDDECEILDWKIEKPRPSRKRATPPIEVVDLLSSGPCSPASVNPVTPLSVGPGSPALSNPSSPDCCESNVILPFKKRKTSCPQKGTQNSPQLVDLDSDSPPPEYESNSSSEEPEVEYISRVDYYNSRKHKKKARSKRRNTSSSSSHSLTRPNTIPMNVPNPYYVAPIPNIESNPAQCHLDGMQATPSTSQIISACHQVASSSGWSDLTALDIANALVSLDDDAINAFASIAEMSSDNNVTTTMGSAPKEEAKPVTNDAPEKLESQEEEEDDTFIEVLDSSELEVVKPDESDHEEDVKDVVVDQKERNSPPLEPPLLSPQIAQEESVQDNDNDISDSPPPIIESSIDVGHENEADIARSPTPDILRRAIEAVDSAPTGPSSVQPLVSSTIMDGIIWQESSVLQQEGNAVLVPSVSQSEFDLRCTENIEEDRSSPGALDLTSKNVTDQSDTPRRRLPAILQRSSRTSQVLIEEVRLSYGNQENTGDPEILQAVQSIQVMDTIPQNGFQFFDFGYPPVRGPTRPSRRKSPVRPMNLDYIRDDDDDVDDLSE